MNLQIPAKRMMTELFRLEELSYNFGFSQTSLKIEISKLCNMATRHSKIWYGKYGTLFQKISKYAFSIFQLRSLTFFVR